MARFGSLRHPWQRLLDPYWTHDLCPLNLCPNAILLAFLRKTSAAVWQKSRVRQALRDGESKSLEGSRTLQRQL